MRLHRGGLFSRLLVGGKISKREVRRAFVCFGYNSEAMPDADFNELFDDSDSDGDGKLTRDEYCRLVVGFGEVVEGY